MWVAKGLGAAGLAAFAVAAASVTPPSQASGGYSGNEGVKGHPTLGLAVPKQSLSSVRRSGLKVRARCNVPCIATVRAGKLGAGRKRLPTMRGTVTVKFNAAGRQRLRSVESLKLSLRGTAVNDANRRSPVAKASVKLK